ncbi:MAG: hypothetical protein AAF791_02920 [Bacteroidota bacterium]
MSSRVSLAEDPALWIAIAVNALLAVPGIGAIGLLWVTLLGELPSDSTWMPIAALTVPLLIGLSLLVGYWRATRGTLRRPVFLWGASLACNFVVVVAGLLLIGEAPAFGLLAAWGAFMCILSGTRVRTAVSE